MFFFFLIIIFFFYIYFTNERNLFKVLVATLGYLSVTFPTASVSDRDHMQIFGECQASRICQYCKLNQDKFADQGGNTS